MHPPMRGGTHHWHGKCIQRAHLYGRSQATFHLALPKRDLLLGGFIWPHWISHWEKNDVQGQTQSQEHASEPNLIADYDVGEFYDEMFSPGGVPRTNCQLLYKHIQELTSNDLRKRKTAAERSMIRLGITFNVYGEQEGTERIIPFDILPRIIQGEQWSWMSKGLKQRIVALNMFIDDIYHDQKILKDGVIPEHVVRSASSFRPQCVGLNPPHGIWCHITGTDLVRDGDGDFYVLEDNLRCPSGVSYVLQNRQLMKQTFPGLFEAQFVRPVDDYCSQLLDALNYMAPDHIEKPLVAVLSPGIYNSAYFEHSFLAQQMGVELVEGRDLVVRDRKVYARTTKGLKAVDVIYRRIDDDFIDPHVFRKDSMLGVPGLMDAYRAGNVALANAPGTGIADDKVIYAYVPDMIKYYLSEDPILPNVPTYVCWDDAQRDHVIKNIADMVVKPGERVRRLRHVDRSAGLEGRTRQVRRLDQSQPAKLHRAANPLPYPGPRSSSMITWREDMSTCDRLSSMDETSTYCLVD